MHFYPATINRLVQDQLILPSDSILVVCGGDFDKQALQGANLTNVVISNMAPHGGVTDYAPYRWEHLDAECIDKEDDSYDWAIVHAGLHHCASPHKALCEMIRVAKKGVVVFEARDSLLMRLGAKLNLVRDYEIQPALLTNGESGGYRNSAIPNYVYRWKEREVVKTVQTYRPEWKHQFDFYYGWAFRTADLNLSKSFVRRIAMHISHIALKVLKPMMWRQGNCFAFAVYSDGAPQPWIRVDESGKTDVDLDYLRTIYDAKRGS